MYYTGQGKHPVDRPVAKHNPSVFQAIRYWSCSKKVVTTREQQGPCNNRGPRLICRIPGPDHHCF